MKGKEFPPKHDANLSQSNVRRTTVECKQSCLCAARQRVSERDLFWCRTSNKRMGDGDINNETQH